MKQSIKRSLLSIVLWSIINLTLPISIPFCFYSCILICPFLSSSNSGKISSNNYNLPYNNQHLPIQGIDPPYLQIASHGRKSRESTNRRKSSHKTKNKKLSTRENEREGKEHAPRNLEVPLHIKRNKTEFLLHIIHNKALIHHIHTPITHQLFQIIRQRLSPQIHSLHTIIQSKILKNRRRVSEAEPAVHHQTTLRFRNQSVRPPRRLVQMHQRRRIGDE